MYISIDPGINNTGIVLFTIVDNKFTVLHTKLVLNIRKLTTTEKEIAGKYGDRLPKLLAIVNEITDLIDNESLATKGINALIIEAPFYSSFRPQTFGSIVEIIAIIRYNIAYKRNIDLKLIEPLLIKKLFSSKGMATKEYMKEILANKIAEGEILINKSIDTLSEHEIDAIAIGYSHYLVSLKTVEGATC